MFTGYPRHTAHYQLHLTHNNLPNSGGLRIHVIPTIDCDRRHHPFFTIIHILIHIDPPFSPDLAQQRARADIETALQSLLDRIIFRRHPSPLNEETLEIDQQRLPIALDRALEMFRSQCPGVDVSVDLTWLRRDVIILSELYKRVKEWFGEGECEGVGKIGLIKNVKRATNAEWDQIMEKIARPIRSTEKGNRTNWVFMQRSQPRGIYREREYFPR